MAENDKTAWRIEPTSDDWAWSITLGCRGRSADERAGMDSSVFAREPLPPESLPVLVEVVRGRWHDRHLTRGLGLMHMMASAELARLLSESDPTGVNLEPIEMALPDGVVLRDRYFMLKVPRVLDALVPEKSPVTERRSRLTGKSMGWAYTKNFVPPTLKRDVVGGHHIWRLANLMPDEIFVSDYLKTEMKRRGLGPFKALPAPLD